MSDGSASKDRSNIGNARVAGMGDDLELTDDRYYLVVVLFQVGYVLAEVPSNMILARSRPSLFIPALMLFWGASCAVIAATQTWRQLVGLRFLLGVAEAGFSVRSLPYPPSACPMRLAPHMSSHIIF